MTVNRGGNRPDAPGSSHPGIRTRHLQESRQLPEPTVCRDCGSVFHNGRWQWGERPSDAHETLCPACHRIHDRCPGGYLTLAGPFLAEHRDEILQRVRNVEELREEPAPAAPHHGGRGQRAPELSITTTDMQLARSLGDAVHHAYKGELDYHYTEEANILRVNWRR
ncbi:MAG: BCAM0308 family protein [Chromatiales bacterium]|nr:BCAM0308 family protein [Chromatiales bacterium]